MATIEEAINLVVTDECEEAFIQCINEQNQESIRVQSYAVKNKLPEILKDFVGITKIVEDGQFLVRVYKKTTSDVLVRDKATGKLVAKEKGVLHKLENRRQVQLMRDDGYSDEQITKILQGNEVVAPEGLPVKEEGLETRGVDSKPEGILSEKEEMKRMKKEEKK